MYFDLWRWLAFGEGLLFVALAHLRAAHVHDDRHVGIDGRSEAQGLLHGDVFGRVVEVLGAAQHVRNLHQLNA